jgi:hypothetical protein
MRESEAGVTSLRASDEQRNQYRCSQSQCLTLCRILQSEKNCTRSHFSFREMEHEEVRHWAIDRALSLKAGFTRDIQS